LRLPARIFLFALLLAPFHGIAQTCTPGPLNTCSPTLNLWLPDASYPNWNVPLNANFNILDTRGGSISKGLVLYASASCGVNSNLLTGGGTNDSACDQALLNKITAAGGGTLVQDGPSLLSAVNTSSTGQTTALQMGPNTTIQCTGGGGFYLANNSNVTMLGNNISGNPNTNLYQSNMEIDDCIFNENQANQNRYELGNSNNEWVFGMWFSGFNTLTLNHVQVWNARTYAYLFANGLALTVNDSTAVQLAGYGAGGNNHDGLHFWGTLQNVNVKHFQDVFGDDDALAFNTDEGVVNYHGLVANNGWQPGRAPTSGGAISDVQVDDVYLDGVNDALRWIGYGPSYSPYPGNITTVSNISLKNIHGTTVGFGSSETNVTATGAITVDGWNLPVTFNNLDVPPGSPSLTMKGIYYNTAVVVPSGNTPTYELTPVVIAYNGEVLGAINGAWSSAPTAVLSLDNSGDLYLGNNTPQTIFRVAVAGSPSSTGTQALFLNNTAGSGYIDTFQTASTTLFAAQGPSVFNGVFRLASSSLPTASAGTVGAYSTNNGMVISGLSAATSLTITFNPQWSNYAFCTATPSVALTTAPYITSMSSTAVTFTFSSLTGSLFVTCNGN
jgi:hypothetical protein